MAHGYLGDGYGKYGDRDPDGSRDDDRERDWRGEHRGEQRGQWRDQDRQGEYRGQRGGEPNRGWSDRDRGFMFEGREGRGEDRGFFSRTADEARDWFRQDEHDYRPGGQQQRASEPQSQRNSRFGSNQDDHYMSWRQQQMDALDRDYQDYCRERQEQFHQDFGSWRSNRQLTNSGAAQPSGQPAGQQPEELELTAQHDMGGTSGTSTDPRNAPQSTTAPESSATLGTNNSENSTTTGRRR